MNLRGFEKEALDVQELSHIQHLARIARGDILKMTTLAKSGHPGGSISSIDIYLVLYSCANIDPKAPYSPDRDRVVVSHGHTSPGVYTALGRLGFFDIDAAISTFRQTGSIFEGHVERSVPGVEWSTGNLGQGLSAACGFALAAKLQKKDFHVFAAMSDGEQQKGQPSEARRFAKKYDLNDLTVIIDYNRIQISGHTYDVMPQDIKANYLSDGWRVLEIDGHDHQAIYQALREGVMTQDTPVAILAETIMSKGVSFIEDDPAYHGKALTIDEYQKAMVELGLEDDLAKYQAMRDAFVPAEEEVIPPTPHVQISAGDPIVYSKDEKTDNRSAWGKALTSLADANEEVPMAVLDCDLATSVKTTDFLKAYPDRFFQGGVQEHNTATIAGALSTQGVLTFFSDFGVFGVDETYNQHRLNDINFSQLKLACTHVGLDVGEDGKTHQCIDYIGAMGNLYGFKVIVPADPNQTDRAVRYMATQPGNFLLAMGRSKLPTILDENGEIFYHAEYPFIYGKADVVREGSYAAIVAIGSMVYRAIEAWELLRAQGYTVLLLNVACPIDLDVDAIRRASETGVVVTYEDHNVRTGLGSQVANVIAEQGLSTRMKKLGISTYGSSGIPDELFRRQGLDPATLAKVVVEEIKQR